jgi:hypothetical protein
LVCRRSESFQGVWINLLGGECTGRSDVGEADQSMHQGQLAGMIELEAGNALATWQHGWFGKLPELPAIHERFKDILLDIVVAINYG